jgi:hypothetical protein
MMLFSKNEEQIFMAQYSEVYTCLEGDGNSLRFVFTRRRLVLLMTQKGYWRAP